jgi:hypothetical protein
MDPVFLALLAPAMPAVVKPQEEVTGYALEYSILGAGLALVLSPGLYLVGFVVLHAAGFIEPVEDDCSVMSHFVATLPSEPAIVTANREKFRNSEFCRGYSGGHGVAHTLV